MLQDFLNADLLPITDEVYFQKIKKSSEELAKKLAKSREKVLNTTLVALDPNIPADNPEVIEVKDLITKNWSTFSTNSKDTPVTFIRAVMFEALQIVSENADISCLIWLAGRNILSQLSLFGKEKELVQSFLIRFGRENERRAVESWSLPSETKLQKLSVQIKEIVGVSLEKEEIETHLKAAAIHSGWGEEGENPYMPSQNNINWSQFFAEKASQGLVDAVNKALKKQATALSANQSQIQEAVNKLLSQTQAEILERNNLLQMRTQLLWWKQSCYSTSLSRSYRGVQTGLLQSSLATDFSAFVPTIYPASADYFLKETHRVLVIDEEQKVKVSEILAQVECSREALKNVFVETESKLGRVSLLGFINGLVWNKYSVSQFRDLVGFPDSAEMTLSDFTVWLFHDLQSLKIVNGK